MSKQYNPRTPLPDSRSIGTLAGTLLRIRAAAPPRKQSSSGAAPVLCKYGFEFAFTIGFCYNGNMFKTINEHEKQ